MSALYESLWLKFTHVSDCCLQAEMAVGHVYVTMKVANALLTLLFLHMCSGDCRPNSFIPICSRIGKILQWLSLGPVVSKCPQFL